MTRVPVRREDTDTRGRVLSDKEGKDWRDAATSQGMLRMAGSHQAWEEARKDVIPWSLQGNVVLSASWIQTSGL